MKRFLVLAFLSLVLVGSAYVAPLGTWAALGELPTHPLVVHGVVVILPLLAVALILTAWKIRFFERFHLALVITTALASLGVVIAKSSGDSLAAAVGLPEFHAEWGNNLVPLVIALLITVILLSLVTSYLRISALALSLRFLLVILAGTTVAMTYVVGHSGAEAVWKDRYASAKVPLALSLDAYSKEEVALHNSPSDCWTIIEGYVYDLTTFAKRHPAGSDAITEMCGVNATEDFLDEHDGDREPRQWLETLKIGELK